MGKKFLPVLEALIIIVLAIFPVFLVLPYRAYIYLSWEGAYRLSEGQLPFRDFGLPVGGMYWAIPALFFKVFGSQVITLLKAQAFLNIISGFAFLSILKSVKVNVTVRTTAVLVYCISYSFQNYWPWYNHSVFVYGFVALAFIVKAIMDEAQKNRWLFLLSGSLFTFLSFFTKQDGGGLIFVICVFLLLYDCYIQKKWLPIAVYFGGFSLFVIGAVLLLSQYDFSYWFNYGQKPHNARISVGEIVNGFLGGSQWLKFYLLIIVFLVLARFKNWNDLVQDKKYMIFLLITLGILCMAVIIQITSYVPAFGNMFFHSFAFAFIFNELFAYLNIRINTKIFLPFLFGGVLLWWSQLPWEYLERMFISKKNIGSIELSSDNENMVGIHNFRLSEINENKVQSRWVTTNSVHTLKRVKMPEATIKGIERLLAMDIVREKKDIKVLNMSELTFLATEIPYDLECNPKAPLWHHLGVGMFNEQLHLYEQRIRDGYYDLVLFEYIPALNNFFPFAIRDILQSDYERADAFDAPRSGVSGTVEVYLKKR